MKRLSLWLLPITAALGVLASAGGCSLGKQAEALYMRQQDVQGELATTLASLEAVRPALAERLYWLEDELHSACQPLREAGKRKFAGQEVGSGLEWAVMTSLSRCASTTGVIETMVQKAQAGDVNLASLLDTLPAAFDGR